MKIVFVRHAEPDYDNDTLTPQGFVEAEALAESYKNFEFDEVYSSPLNRAKLTAETFLKYHPNRALVVKDWLAELAVPIRVPYSEQEVIPWDFIPSQFVREEPFFSGDAYFSSKWLKSGEVEKLYNEAAKGLDSILQQNGYRRKGRIYQVEKSNTKTILVFCHFGMMSALMSHMLHIPFVLLTQHFECQPTGVTTLVTEERQKGIAQFRCLRYSDVSHLTAKGIEPSFSGRFCEIFDSNDRH